MENLPTDLWPVIASYLDDKSRRVMRLTNMEWFKTIKYSDFKFYFTTNDQLPHILKRLAQYSWPISVDFKNQKFDVTKENSNDFGKLTHLTGLRARFYGADPHPFTNLTNLEHVGTDLPLKTMRYFTKLKNIFLESIEYAVALDLVRFANLESVDWLIYDDDTDIDPINMLRNANRLTRLEMESPPLKMDEKNLSRFTNLKRFSLTHATKDINMPYLPNLESLDLRVNNIGSLSSLQRTLTALTGNCYSVDLSSIATLTNLKQLALAVRSSDILSSPHDMTYLAALTNLENLIVYPRTGSDYSQSLEYINSKKLTSLEYLGEVDMQYIAKFGNKLQSLTVPSIAAQNNNDAFRFCSNLTNLRILDCRKKQFPIIETLTKLEDLEIRIDDPNYTSADELHLGKLTSLKSLSVSTNIHDDINDHLDSGSFHQHMRLTKISCDWSVDKNFVERIAAMTSLQFIHFPQSGHLTDISISLLTGLTNLTNLYLGAVGDKITGVTLTLLTSLRQLTITGSDSKFAIDGPILQQQLTRLLYYVHIS